MSVFAKIIFLLVGVLFLASCVPNNSSFPTASLGTPYKNPKIVSGLLFSPKGAGPFAAVVLLHTCGGLRPHVTEDWPNYLTGLGYVVLSVDSYGPRGVSSCTQLPGGPLLQTEDAFGALDHLAKIPSVDATRVGVMGFSAGAIAINSHLVGAWKRKPNGIYFKAAIALYGYCWRIGAHNKDGIPLMEIVAEKDKKHAPSCISEGKVDPSIKVEVLAGAYHSFDSDHRGGGIDPGGSFMQYSGSATEKARQLTKAFFAQHLGK